MRYGLSKAEIKAIIQRQLDINPDLKYYIDNPYFDEFIALLIDGICMAIHENSERVIKDIERDIKKHSRSLGR